MFIREGVAVDGHFLFLLLKDIGWAEGGIGERRTDRRTRVGTGTKGGLLTGGRRGLYDLRLDDAQNLSDLAAYWGDYHGNFVEEVTSVTRAG
jgi:hypothetical protein